jgi:centrin-1
MRALGYDIKKADVVKYFAEVDKDISTTLNFEEFVKIVGPKLRNKDSRDEIMKIFKLFDEDNTGKISFKNLKKIAAELGENISDEELNEMIQEADKDSDGLITPDDFYRYVKN